MFLNKYIPIAWLASCLLLASCQREEEEASAEWLPMEVTVTRAQLTPGEDGKADIVTFKPDDTFLVVAHTGAESAPATWYSGLYRFPKEGELSTLRPLNSYNFDNDTYVDATGSLRGGLYLPTSTAGIVYQLHLVWPAAKFMEGGPVAVPRDKSIYVATPAQPCTLTAANPYFTMPFPKDMQLIEMSSALKVYIKQSSADATAEVSNVRLLNAGDRNAQMNIHTHRALLAYADNVEIQISKAEEEDAGDDETADTGLEGSWASKNDFANGDSIVYYTADSIRIHCANYKTQARALTLAMHVVYTLTGQTDPIETDITIPLTFLDAEPSMRYDLTLTTNPRAVYVTYTVASFSKTVELEGNLGKPVYTAGTLSLTTGEWKEGGRFDNTIE